MGPLEPAIKSTGPINPGLNSGGNAEDKCPRHSYTVPLDDDAPDPAEVDPPARGNDILLALPVPAAGWSIGPMKPGGIDGAAGVGLGRCVTVGGSSVGPINNPVGSTKRTGLFMV